MFLLGCPIGEAVRRKQNAGDKASPEDRENKGGAGGKGRILRTRNGRPNQESQTEESWLFVVRHSRGAA